MKLYSKIKSIFLVAFILLSLLFLSYLYIQKTNYIKSNFKRYNQVARFTLMILRTNTNINNITYNELLKENEFKIIQDFSLLKDAKVIKKRRIRRAIIKFLKYKKREFVYIRLGRKKVVLESLKRENFVIKTALLYLLSLMLLVGLYFWIISSLKPLKELHNKVLQIKDGNLDISLKSDKKDEIAQVANTLDEAIAKINALVKSRRLFLRAIMHELKTPVGKGRLLNEFLNDSKLKERYDLIFERLELLIEEFAKIEQLLSSNYKPKIAKYNIIDIIENSIELLMLDNNQKDSIKIIKESSFLINSDFSLLSIAIKNLIDNAIKYSIDKKAKIIINSNSIQIINKGASLQTPIKNYNTPQFKDGKLSLGIYVALNITKLLKLNLKYTYKDKENIFTISKEVT